MIFFENIKNSIDFWLRKRIKISRGNYSPKNEPKAEIFDNLAKEKEEKFLLKYNLAHLRENSTKVNYLENLYTIDLLENFLNPLPSKNLKILDIGSKNWSYAQGEYHFFKYNNFEKEIYLDGIELDANRLYLDLCSRFDYAQYYIKNLINARYIAGNFLNHRENYDYIVWVLPFVTTLPLLKWGLPLKHFQPEEMLKHAYNNLLPDGKILIVNQGEEEYKIQQKLCESLKIPYFGKGLFKSVFMDFQPERFITMIHK